MRGYVQCEVFSFPPFGRHNGRWDNNGPRGVYEEILFGCGPYRNSYSRCGPPGIQGPPGHHTHFDPHGTPGQRYHGPDHHHAVHSPDRCGCRPLGHQGPFGIPGHGPHGPGPHYSLGGSPDRCGRRSPGHTRHHRHGPRGHDHHRPHRHRRSPESSPDRCGHRFPGYPGCHGPYGPHETPNKEPGIHENNKSACHGFPRHCRQECRGYERPKPRCCEPYKIPGKCCDRSTSDSDKSGNETCDRGALTENPKGPSVVLERLVLEKAPRCYSV